MDRHFITQISIKCGHIAEIDTRPCCHEKPCRLGEKLLEMIFIPCGRCTNDRNTQKNFGNLKHDRDLIRYWGSRELNGMNINLYGPFKPTRVLYSSVPGMRKELRKSIEGTWRRELVRYVRLASEVSGPVYVEGAPEQFCDCDELGTDKLEALVSRAIEMTIEEAKRT